eukprot:scaffold35698_cov63-Attheya_sp.AAC.25
MVNSCPPLNHPRTNRPVQRQGVWNWVRFALRRRYVIHDEAPSLQTQICQRVMSPDSKLASASTSMLSTMLNYVLPSPPLTNSSCCLNVCVCHVVMLRYGTITGHSHHDGWYARTEGQHRTIEGTICHYAQAEAVGCWE